MRRICLAVMVLGGIVPSFAQDSNKTPRNANQWSSTVQKAVKFLQDKQDADGTWSRARSPGVTGIVLTSLLRSGQVTIGDEKAVKALKFIESLVNEKEGHIAGQNPQAQLKNYVTCVNVMALKEANADGRYRHIIGNAAEFLKRLQFDEGEGKTPENDFYGGAGYDSKSRPDLSNTQFFLDALQTAGIGKDDPAVKRALIFVSRCQNLKGEHNDQPWADKINDGSFIYSAAGGGETKVEGAVPGVLPGYGSMTYAGVKSMIYCGVSKDDPRVVKSLDWIRKNYTVDANPGMPPQFAQRGLYYYYHTMAKCLNALGIDQFEDAKGIKHDWRADIVAALAKRQRPDGSWINETDRWMEGDPNLVTAYALLALSYCKPVAR